MANGTRNEEVRQLRNGVQPVAGGGMVDKAISFDVLLRFLSCLEQPQFLDRDSNFKSHFLVENRSSGDAPEPINIQAKSVFRYGRSADQMLQTTMFFK